jgi:hypothetical protein
VTKAEADPLHTLLQDKPTVDKTTAKAAVGSLIARGPTTNLQLFMSVMVAVSGPAQSVPELTVTPGDVLNEVELLKLTV